jgi:hypothetical protein
LLVGHEGRSGLVYVHREPINDPAERLQWIQQQLLRARFKGEPKQDLTAMLWVKTEPHEPLTIMEIHNLETRLVSGEGGQPNKAG